MPLLRLAAAAAHFGRDLDACVDRVAALVAHAREDGASLVVLPDGALGGYLGDLRHPTPDALPLALERDHPVFQRLARLAWDLVLCLGYCERDGEDRFNAAVALIGDGVLGRHRKVHLPPGEAGVYTAGDAFTAFDTPLGRMGTLIDNDKTFPEAARTLALAGARVLACPSAWPASITMRSSSLVHDRQTRLFDLYDSARAAENQVVLVSSNQTGSTGRLRFLGHAKVVGPGGEVLARTGVKAGLAMAELDIDAEVDRARQVLHHLKDRRPDTYAGTA